MQMDQVLDSSLFPGGIILANVGAHVWMETGKNTQKYWLVLEAEDGWEVALEVVNAEETVGWWMLEEGESPLCFDKHS